MSVGAVSQEQHDPAARVRRSVAGAVLTRAAFAVGVLTIIAAVLRFVGLGHQGFWFDEGNTALLVHFSPGKMLGLIPQSESTPPLYYCVLWVWARIFGYGEAGLRSLSALAGVATVPVAFLAARRLVSPRVGLAAAAMVACNPLLIWYSQEARSYALLVLLTAVALLAFAHAETRPGPRVLLGWVLASALALATHYYAILAIVPQALWLLATHRRVRAVQLAVGVVGLCGAALIPLAVSQNGTGNAGWIAHIALGPRIGQIFPQFVIGTGAPAYGVLEPLGAVMVIAGLVLLVLRSEPSERRAALSVGGLGLGGLLLSLLVVAVGVDDLITRNVIAVWLPLAIMVAGGYGASRSGLLGVAAVSILCAVGIAAAIGVQADRSLQRPDWRAVARVLGSRPAIGERVILVQHYRDLLPLSLYLPHLRFWRSDAPQHVRELDVIAISSPRERLCWWGGACNLTPSQMQSSYPISGFRPSWRRGALQFTVLRLLAPRPTTVTRDEVARALTTTTLRRDELLVQS